MNDSASSPAGAPPAIEIRGLNKLSVRGADLTVWQGDRVAIIGKTGQGKSVLLRCILGLLSPDSGDLRLMGRKVTRRSIASEGVGVAFQHPGLLDAWSVAKNLRVATRDVLSRSRIVELLASVGLTSVDPESSVTLLSGGQQKRLSLLRALLRGNRLVVLDEPTSGLDPRTAEAIAEMMADAIRNEPRTLLLVTHDYETAVRLCNRIITLRHDGTLVEVPIPSTGRVVDDAVALRDALPDEEATIKGRTTRPPRWGIVPLTLDLLAFGVPLAGVAMGLLGTLLVAQSAKVGAFDVSRYIPGAVLLGVCREMAPLVVGFLLAARAGARVTAELAGMSYTAQLDSLRALGRSPIRHFFLPFLTSAAIAFPISILAGAALAIGAAGLYVGLPTAGLSIGTRRFFDLARERMEMALLFSMLLKGVGMAATVVTASYWCGARSVTSAPAVGRAVTRAAVLGSLSVVLVDIVVSWLFFG